MKKLIFICALALAGCAVPQQRPKVSAADDPSNPCFASTATDARFQVLARHLTLINPNTASLEMLNDASKPNDEERHALSLWAARRTVCIQAGHEFRYRYFPAEAAVYENGLGTLQQLISSLYAGKISYGEFNTQRQQLSQSLRTQLEVVERQKRNDFAAQQAARREANAAQAAQTAQTLMLMQAMQPKPVFVPQPPVITPSVNCTSFRTGNVTNTNCN